MSTAFAVSTARQGVADHLRAGGTVARDGLDVGAHDAFREALSTYSWALDGLRELAASGDNDSARVGAIRAAVLVAEKRIELLTAAGVIPSADALLIARVAEQQRRFAAVVLDVLAQHGVEFFRAMGYVDGDARPTVELGEGS